MQQQKLRVQNISCLIPKSDQLGGIFFGNIYGAQNTQILKQYGIRAVLTATNETNIEYKAQDIPFHKKIKMQDKDNYKIIDHIKQCITFINYSRKFTNVFIHCYAGVSRSTTIVIAYLMYTYGWNLNLTLEFTKFKRIIAQPNNGFIQQLQQYQRNLYPSNITYNQNKQITTNLPNYPNFVSHKTPLTTFQNNRKLNRSLEQKPFINSNSIQKINTKYNQPSQLGNVPLYPMHFTPSKPIPKQTYRNHDEIPIPKIIANKRTEKNFKNYPQKQGLTVRQQSPELHQYLSSPRIRKETQNGAYSEKSKTVSRCLIRPKDLPGYGHY